jgi:hypothetical protein
MDLVLRPANDRFLQEVVFPAFTLGMTDGSSALSLVLEQVGDHRTRILTELMLEHGVDGGLDGLAESPSWIELVHRLLFSEWADGGVGWQVSADPVGFAGRLDAGLHLALMLEHPDYPYGDPEQARSYRAAYQETPVSDFALSSLIAGLWDPPAAFYPEWVLKTVGRGESRVDRLFACSDWAWRDWEIVGRLNRRLPGLIERLLERERDRLPVELPDAPELSAYWQGKTAEPPQLTVAFSGLGRETSAWIRELGELTAMIRNAARAHRGLTALTTRHSSMWDR